MTATNDLIYMVQNDTGPDRQFVVTRGSAKTIVNLTGATVKLAIKSNTTNTITNGAHQTCTLTDPTAGICTYVFQTGDLPDAGGDYQCDLQVTISGKTETYYNIIKIRTRPEIAT
jgi:hypothetical protein